MTGLALAACVILLLGVGRASNRGLLLGLALSLTLPVSGYWLQSLGRVGGFLLSFLQPLRAVSLVPPLAAAAVAFGLQRGAVALASAVSASGRPRLGRAVPWTVALLGFGVTLVGLPSRLRHVSEVLATPARPGRVRRPIAGDPGLLLRAGTRLAAELVDGSALDDLPATRLESCLAWGGVDLASAVPIATAGAVGAHVGVLARAAQFLEPTRPASQPARRRSPLVTC